MSSTSTSTSASASAAPAVSAASASASASASSSARSGLNVFIRIRPLTEAEQEAGVATLVFNVESEPHVALETETEEEEEEEEEEFKQSSASDQVLDPVEADNEAQLEAPSTLSPCSTTSLTGSAILTLTTSMTDQKKNDPPSAAISTGSNYFKRKIPLGKNNKNLNKRCGGLAYILTPKHDNATTFAITLAPVVQRVLAGETACCFCYGHTGSGKTHTIIGYGTEFGLYYHATAILCRAIQNTELTIQIRFGELYQGKVYDLLDERAECFIREDGDGNVHIRSSTDMDVQGQVRVQSLKADYARTVEEVSAIVNKALTLRAVGSSAVHDQSSRSHAVLELEMVTHDVIAARKAVIEAEAELVPIGKQRDYKFINIRSRCYSKDPTVPKGWVENLNAVPPEEHQQLAELNEAAERAEQKLREARDKERSCTNVARNMVNNSTGAGHGHGHGHGIASSCDSKSSEIQSRFSAVAHSASGSGCGPSGGTLVFVDLAGAEYASSYSSTTTGAGSSRNRSTQEMKEAKEINGSLLALKECIRSLYRDRSSSGTPTQSASANKNSNGGHIPFRNSKLTLFLRRHLLAQASSAVMIANISLAASQGSGSANTMQYAELVATAAATQKA